MEQQEKQQNENRRLRLINIIKNHFEYDNDIAVRAIKDATGHEVSVRSIQAWLIDPKRSSNRTVPEWALRGLEDYINRPEKQEELKQHAERVQERRKAPRQDLDWSDEVRNKNAVEFATSEIEAENRETARWQEQFGKEGGKVLAEAFLSLRKDNSAMSKALAAMARAINDCDNYDAFKNQANLAMRDAELTNFFVRDTRTALEKLTGEFSNNEGLPTSIKNK